MGSDCGYSTNTVFDSVLVEQQEEEESREKGYFSISFQTLFLTLLFLLSYHRGLPHQSNHTAASRK